jgi:hypothetical protein
MCQIVPGFVMIKSGNVILPPQPDLISIVGDEQSVLLPFYHVHYSE